MKLLILPLKIIDFYNLKPVFPKNPVFDQFQYKTPIKTLFKPVARKRPLNAHIIQTSISLKKSPKIEKNRTLRFLKNSLIWPSKILA